ncbi:helix-turn-helix domain-containing protein [Psychrobacter faecalis]
MSTLHKLYNEESSRIDFNTIEQLCEFLDVQVGEEGGSKISIVPNLLG